MSELNTMNLEDLKAQADVLGVEYANNIGADALRKKIVAVLGDEEEITKPTVLAKSTTKMVTINIARSKEDKQPVPVGLNGKVYRMKRGEDVTVPAGVVDILRNAIQVFRDPDTGEDHEVEAYPFHEVH
jgi:hypothetical protein